MAVSLSQLLNTVACRLCPPGSTGAGRPEPSPSSPVDHSRPVDTKQHALAGWPQRVDVAERGTSLSTRALANRRSFATASAAAPYRHFTLVMDSREQLMPCA